MNAGLSYCQFFPSLYLVVRSVHSISTIRAHFSTSVSQIWLIKSSYSCVIILQMLCRARSCSNVSLCDHFCTIGNSHCSVHTERAACKVSFHFSKICQNSSIELLDCGAKMRYYFCLVMQVYFLHECKTEDEVWNEADPFGILDVQINVGKPLLIAVNNAWKLVLPSRTVRQNLIMLHGRAEYPVASHAVTVSTALTSLLIHTDTLPSACRKLTSSPLLLR